MSPAIAQSFEARLVKTAGAQPAGTEQPKRKVSVMRAAGRGVTSAMVGNLGGGAIGAAANGLSGGRLPYAGALGAAAGGLYGGLHGVRRSLKNQQAAGREL